MPRPIRRISANLVDPVQGRIYPATLFTSNGRINRILPEDTAQTTYILPGLVDAHVHVESSMLVPTEFARQAVRHGTVAAVSDPHEIANVLGIDGVWFMVKNGKRSPFKFAFGAPSCVPATGFETAGAKLGVVEIEELLRMDEIGYLAEMMNFPGVLATDPGVLAKLELARKYNKPMDGHGPGLTAGDLRNYLAAGISTDHECSSLAEAREKAALGMKILIRQGSAARDLQTLLPLLDEYPELCMFCSDDLHPDGLRRGHVNQMVKTALAAGHDLISVIRAAVLNPVRHYKLDTGLLREGDPADFIEVDSLERFNILKTVINGELVAENGTTLLDHVPVEPINNFQARPRARKDFQIADPGGPVRVIRARDGQLVTGLEVRRPAVDNTSLVADPERDLLKIAVVNRYQEALPGLGFITGFGLKHGAIASSVAHDSHNIIAVGASDEMLCQAINLVIEHRGGLAVKGPDFAEVLPLPVAGLMSLDDGAAVAGQYGLLDLRAKELGSTLTAPFMTLSFMALLVIPQLKLSDKGLFDGQSFSLVPLATDDAVSPS
ncbi:MAG: adenine deaminase [Desulfobacterales bacterium]|nr:adenine deaminase [Desulfobacterales bacterium]